MQGLLLFAVLFSIAQMKLFYSQGDQVQYEDLSNHNQIEITETLSHLSLVGLEKRVFLISVDAKTKKIAYESLKHQERKVLAITHLYHLIPNNNSFLISKIKSKYISRTKMWNFYQTFAIYGTRNQLSDITKLFQKRGVKQTKKLGEVQFYKEKSLLLKLFASGKRKVMLLLDKHQNFGIRSIKDLQYRNDVHLERNSEYSEEEQGEEYNETKSNFEEEALSVEECSQEKEQVFLKLTFSFDRKENLQHQQEDFDL